ncbi:MAG: hypothetical protein MK078_02745 [Crocinitomicaceae bacterium]|nr:hypothetical protein [Crocinitomicaceae bacterium]
MYGKEAYEIAFEIDHLVLKYKTSYLMYVLEKRNGKYKQSLETYKQYVKLRYSVKNIEAKEALIKQEYNYEYEERLLQIV